MGMTTKEWLEQVRHLDKAVNVRCDELYRLKCQCEKITPTISGMPKCGGAREDVYIRYAEKREEVNGAVDELAELRAEVVEAIGAVRDETLRDLLTHRYIDGWEWGRIADKLGRTLDMTRTKLHYRAIDELEKIRNTTYSGIA